MPRGHAPQRCCIGCRRVRPKGELLRIVRTPEGEIRADAGGKMPGRGAYLCPGEECLRLALKQRRLERALGKQVEAGVIEEIVCLARTLAGP